MADPRNGNSPPAPIKSTVEARQAVTGHNVRYVLGTSLAAIVVLFAIIWIAFFKM